MASRSHLFEQVRGKWARKLDASRTPVREAMREMRQERLLMRLCRGGRPN